MQIWDKLADQIGRFYFFRTCFGFDYGCTSSIRQMQFRESLTFSQDLDLGNKV